MKKVPLGDVAEFINGRAFKPSEWVLAGLPIIRIQNLTNEDAVFNYCDKDVETKYYVRDDDLLVSWSATLDVFIWNRGDAILNQHIFKAVPDTSKITKKFLFYALKHVMDELRAQTHGATMKHITRKPFEQTKIILPPLPEQERIVRLLDEAESLRAARLRANARMEQFVPALFQEMFGDFSKQQQILVSDVAEVQGGLQLTPKRNDFSLRKPYLRVANVQRGYLVLDEIKDIGLTEDEFTKTKLKNGDILVVEGNGNPEEIGRAAIWHNQVENCVHQNHLIRIRCNAEILLPDYLVIFLNSETGRKYFLKSGNTTSGLVTISTSVVKRCSIPLPPLSLQREFAERVGEARAIQSAQGRSAGRVEALYQSMLSRAFAGEL
jgi:type I restriction enzyme S subunit